MDLKVNKSLPGDQVPSRMTRVNWFTLGKTEFGFFLSIGYIPSNAIREFKMTANTRKVYFLIRFSSS